MSCTLHAEVRRLFRGRSDAELGLADDQVGVGVDHAGHGLRRSMSFCEYSLSWSRSGPPIQNMISASMPPPKALTGATWVRRSRPRTAAGPPCAPSP